MITTFKKSVLFSATCLQPLALVGGAAAMLAGVPAFAQDADPQAEVTEEAANSNTIVVTGSLIRNPNLVAVEPGQRHRQRRDRAQAVEHRRRNAARNAGRRRQHRLGVNNGNGGASYVDLRGLGSNRNIVLLDGNRIAPSDLTAASISTTSRWR